MSKFHADDDKIIDLPDPRTRERMLEQLSGALERILDVTD